MCRFVEVTLDMLMFEEGSLEGWELGESETAGETGWEAERGQETQKSKSDAESICLNPDERLLP
jgi:hypothetical protein